LTTYSVHPYVNRNHHQLVIY